jgi:hypothetical protein
MSKTVFYIRSVQRCYKEDNWGNRVSSVRESVSKRVQLEGSRRSERTWARETEESPRLEAVAKERLQKA